MAGELFGLERGQKAVLVLAEVQRRVVMPQYSTSPIAAEAQARGIVEKIDQLARTCRAAGLPVIHVHKWSRPDKGGNFNNCRLSAASNRRPTPDDLDYVLDSPLDVPASDYVIKRVHGISSFHNTELESIMRYYGAETVILVGVSTDMNIVATSIEAVNRGLNVVVPEDCIAGSSPQVHRTQIDNMLRLLATITDSGAVTAALNCGAHGSELLMAAGD